MTQTAHSEAAAQNLEAARDELAAVIQRIADGEATEADLEAAERRVRFCEVRLEGARRRESEEAEEERLRALEKLAKQTRAGVEGVDVHKAQKAAQRTLERYVEACIAHNAHLDEAADELLSQEDLPEGFGVVMGSDGHSPTLEGKTYRRVRPMVSVADMAREVLRRHIPHGYIDLERPY